MSAKTPVNPNLGNLPTVGFLGHKAAASFISPRIPEAAPDHIPPAMGSKTLMLGSNSTGSGQEKSHPWLVGGGGQTHPRHPHCL